MAPQDPIPPVSETQIDAGPLPDAGPDPQPALQLAPDLPDTSPNEAAVIITEGANPMIDIHPPQHGGLTRRDFFVHLFTVVLGILIAIGLEQAVEYLHHHELAAEARRALVGERSQNETANDLNIFAIRRHQQDLKHDLAVLEALRAHRTVPPGPFIVRLVTSFYAQEEWQKIHQSGTINYLSGNLGGATFRYEVQGNFTGLADRSYSDLSRAASVLRSATDPPSRSFEQNMSFSQFFRDLEAAHENLPQQQVDAAWATMAEPGNVAALSPAQIDDFERAIQIALADDDAMLNLCFTIKRNLARNPMQ